MLEIGNSSGKHPDMQEGKYYYVWSKYLFDIVVKAMDKDEAVSILRQYLIQHPCDYMCYNKKYATLNIVKSFVTFMEIKNYHIGKNIAVCEGYELPIRITKKTVLL